MRQNQLVQQIAHVLPSVVDDDFDARATDDAEVHADVEPLRTGGVPQLRTVDAREEWDTTDDGRRMGSERSALDESG